MDANRTYRRVAAVAAIVGMLGSALPALAATGHTKKRVPARHIHHKRKAPARHTRVVRAAALAGSPSGVAMPVGNLPGWRQVFTDDFTGSTLNSNKWWVYSGQPGGDPGGWWDPSHVYVSNGTLVLAGYRDPADGNKWTTGGVSSGAGLSQTYGKYLVRYRFDPGVGIAHAILLWPTDNSWPPEIDFSEDNGSNRQTTYATLHYGANNSQIGRQTTVDLTQWHTLGVEWARGQVRYTLDGRVWATVSSSHVPSVPMVMDIQTQAWNCNGWELCPTSTTPSHVNLYVDWVVAYAAG